VTVGMLDLTHSYRDLWVILLLYIYFFLKKKEKAKESLVTMGHPTIGNFFSSFFFLNITMIIISFYFYIR
jgi:hypothetical protein